jgi:hypothetical protein
MAIMDLFPIWAVYLVTVILALVAAEIGFRIGLRRLRQDPDSGDLRATGTVVAGILGLMAFLMAFSIGIVINQQGNRKALVVEEANAIGTAYLRADFLDEADRGETQDLLREYVKIRIDAANDPTLFASVVTRSEEIQGELWSIVVDTVKQGNESDITGLFIESINDVIDVHTLRLAAIDLRLPEVLGMVLYVSTLLSFLLVGIANSIDKKRDFAAILLFALAFVAVLTIIVDLDRPQQGLMTVSQTALTDLLRQMTPPGP